MSCTTVSSSAHGAVCASVSGKAKQARGSAPVRFSRNARPSACVAQHRAISSLSCNVRNKRPAKRCLMAAAAVEEPPVSSDFDDVGDGRVFALAVAQEADMLKGKDIMVLHVAPIASWTSYMVLVSAFSRPQMQAMLFKIGKMALEKYGKELPYSKQVSQGKDWECMDFGEVVVQVMTTESREFYDLEGFYSQAEEVELPFETETTQGMNAGWQKKLQ